MSTDLAVREHESNAISVQTVLDRLGAIQELMKQAMVPGVDYGTIPGTGSKPTLLKPGAEKLAVMFRLAPSYETTKHFHNDGHLTVESTCKILSQRGEFLGEASAMCSTKESKYAYRMAARVCPSCGKPAIIKGKAEYGGGWLCFKKKDGCGAKFADDDSQITGQTVGRVANEDLADSYNTVLRIAEKRSLLGAIRLVTGSSALFDEEIPTVNENDDAPPPKQNNRKPAKSTDAPPTEKDWQPEIDDALHDWKAIMEPTDPMIQPPSVEWINTKGKERIKAIPDSRWPVRQAVLNYIIGLLTAAGYKLNADKIFVLADSEVSK